MPGLPIKAFWLQGQWPLYVDAQSGQLVLAGARTEARVGADNGTGSLVFSGSIVEREIIPPRAQVAAFIRVG